jgi:methionyl-tRNA formyltransferase
MMNAWNAHTFPSMVFVGVHMEARAPFNYLVDEGYNVLGLVTLMRESMAQVSGAIDLTPVAEQGQIPVLRVRNINEPEAVAWIREKAPALLLVIGWTQLLKPDLLRVPKLACLGFHASLLPKSRGRAPVNWALINGETVTGNTMIILEPEADSGDIVAQRTIPISEEDDCKTIYQKVGETEVEMLDEVLPIIRSGVLPRRKQDDSHATVMPKRRPEDGVINWNRTTQEIYNWVRALTDPYPGAFSLLNGDRVWVWTARADGAPIDGESRGPGEVIVDSDGWPWVSTADGWIRLVTVQREDGPKISGQAAGATFLLPGIVFDRTNEAAK